MGDLIRCFFLEPTEEKKGTKFLFRRTDTGELMTLSEAPPGAMWYADWYIREGSNVYRGPDGHCLVVRTPPDHDWLVDGRCSNCTLPNDWEHKCWCRHGQVPNITVNKVGKTCRAGAGSIGVWNADHTAYVWHGFLENGYLRQC